MRDLSPYRTRTLAHEHEQKRRIDTRVSSPNYQLLETEVQRQGYIGLDHAGFAVALNLPKVGLKLLLHDADGTKSDLTVWKLRTLSRLRATQIRSLRVKLL